MKKQISSNLISLLFFIVLQLSCKGLENRVGPCVHIYEEPILHIEFTRNTQTGMYLQTIILSEIKIDSIKADIKYLIIESRGVAMLDSSHVCNPPCSFGTQAGNYSFRVSAVGFVDTVIVCSPFYSVSKGGCPSSSNGGLRINFSIRPL
jgi:hypothetical protein